MATHTEDPAATQYGTGGGERLQDAASSLVDQAGRTAEATASKTMTQAGDALDQVARAVRDAGSGLREQQPTIADFVDTAATKVEDAAQYLRAHHATDLLDEATSFARRQPVVVVGGAMLAGLALGRLMKSSTSAMSGSGQGRYSGGYGAYGGYGSQGGWNYREPYGSASYPAVGGSSYGSAASGSNASGYGAGGAATGYGTASGTQSGYAGGRSGVTTEDAGSGTDPSGISSTGTTETVSGQGSTSGSTTSDRGRGY
jgi:ElaB/YqjD/DUF883 family membrane-anchored ribosome-binding protein